MTDTQTRELAVSANGAIPSGPMMMPNAERAGQIIEAVVAKGNLADLTPQQRGRYYVALCQSIGLNPMTRPFEYITLDGRLTLYPRKEATDQLGRIFKVTTETVRRETIEDLHFVYVRASTPDGRCTEAVGIVPMLEEAQDARSFWSKKDNKRIEVAAKPERKLTLIERANVYMKTETKAKRRAILSLVGLGWPDDGDRFSTEVEVERPYVDRHGNVAAPSLERALPVSTATAHDIFAPDDEPPPRQPRRAPPAVEEEPPGDPPEFDMTDADFTDEDQPLPPSPRSAAIAADLDAVLAEGAPSAPTESDAAFDALGSAGGDVLLTATHQAKLAEAAQLQAECKSLGISPAPLHPQASELVLDGWIPKTKRQLAAHKQNAPKGS